MRKLAIVLTIAFAFVACNKASDADVDQGIKLWNELWDGYFKSLEDNKTDAAKAIAAGQKYIDDNKDKIGKVRGIFAKRGTQDQIDKVEAAVKEGMSGMVDRMADVSRTMSETMMKQPDMTPDKMTEVMTNFAETVQAQAMDLLKQIQG